MADFAGFVARLKENKLALPAILVGVVAGGYVLLKKGGLSAGGGGSLSEQSFQKAVDSAAQGDPGAGGGGGSGDSGDAYAQLKEQQDTFAKSIVDQFNGLVDNVTGALGSIGGGSYPAPELGTQALAPVQLPEIQNPIGSFLPDFSALYQQATQQSPPGSQYQSPGLKLAASKGGMGLSKSIQSVAKKPITPAVYRQTVASKVTRKLAEKKTIRPVAKPAARPPIQPRRPPQLTVYKPQPSKLAFRRPPTPPPPKPPARVGVRGQVQRGAIRNIR